MAHPIRRGNQQPTFSTVGEWAYSDGDYAVEMFGGYGIDFYESQKHEMRVSTSPLWGISSCRM